MTLEEALYTRLSEFAPLAALVGDRIYPILAPQGAESPRITFQRISGQSDHVLTGPSGLTETRVQIDVWADETDAGDGYTIVRRAALQVKAALDGFRGLVEGDGSPTPSLRIKSTRLENDSDLPEEERRVSRVSMDFIIAHDEES